MCLTVPLHHWGTECAPSPWLSSGIAADSRVTWWEPRGLRVPGDIPREQQPLCWAAPQGQRDWEQSGGWQLPVLPVLPVVVWELLGSLAFVRVPCHRKAVEKVIAELMEGTAKHQGREKQSW